MTCCALASAPVSGNPVSPAAPAPGGSIEPEAGVEPVIPRTVVSSSDVERPFSYHVGLRAQLHHL